MRHNWKRSNSSSAENIKKNLVDLTLLQNPGLIGGFVIRAGDREIDWSLRGRLKRLEQKIDVEVNCVGSISSSEIISILKEEIENYDLDTGDQEVGQVIWVVTASPPYMEWIKPCTARSYCLKTESRAWFRTCAKMKSAASCSAPIPESGRHQGHPDQKESGHPRGRGLRRPRHRSIRRSHRRQRPIASEDYRPIEHEPPESLTASPSAFPWRPEFFPSTPCSPLAAASVS